MALDLAEYQQWQTPVAEGDLDKAVTKPFAGYADFAACVAANQNKDNPEAYCGAIQAQAEKAWSESNQIRDPDGKFAGTRGGSGGGGAAGTVEYKLVGGDEEDGYMRPHPPLSDKGFWGYSHHDAKMYSGESAAMMGLDGYTTDVAENRPARQKVARDFLERIASGRETAGENIYHSKVNSSGKKFSVGDSLTLPLTATSSERSASYAFKGNLYDSGNPNALVYKFEPNTKVMGYSKNTKTQIAEGDGIWSEALTAGKFTVIAVGPGPTYGWKQLPSTEVTLRQTQVFDPSTGWK